MRKSRSEYEPFVGPPESGYWCRHGRRESVDDECEHCTLETLEMKHLRADQGPWTAHKSGPDVYLYSDDFRHDVSLKVSGDFWDVNKKLAYAQLLADQLNDSIMREYAEPDSRQLRLFL